MTKIQKIKKFISDNRSEILFYGAITGMMAFTAYLGYKAQEQENAVRNWIHEQHLAGNVVHQLVDGSYIAVKYAQQ